MKSKLKIEFDSKKGSQQIFPIKEIIINAKDEIFYMVESEKPLSYWHLELMFKNNKTKDVNTITVPFSSGAKGSFTIEDFLIDKNILQIECNEVCILCFQEEVYIEFEIKQ
jgi:hypothetical protein